MPGPRSFKPAVQHPRSEMPWNPGKYHQFQDERFAPFEDLLKLISIRSGMRVIDLGCGTGELTLRLAESLPNSDVVGIDSSGEMLARAKDLRRTGLHFEQGTIEGVQGEWDLVFSHAALHWVDDHRSLIPRLMSLVRSGGQLAVQVPSNETHPTHHLILETARQEPFRTALNGWVRESPVLSISEYAELLFAAGARDVTVFEKVYPISLEGADQLADWTSGTTLVPYFERLPGSLHEPFLAHYRERLRALFPSTPVVYTFRRTLFAATRPA